MSVNKMIAIGNIVKDPAVAETTTGKTVANFTLACSEKIKGKDSVEYINVVAWEKLAQNIQAYTKKGSKVYVEGKLTTRSYDDKEGNKKYLTEVVAFKVDFLTPKGTSSAQVESNEPDFSDDIPF